MLTSLRVRNFKRLEDVEVELGTTVVFIGPNNSGKTTALQALALWETGLRKWLERRPATDVPERRPGITINRRDLISVPVPDANLLWTDLHTRAVQRSDGKQETRNIRVDILVSGVTAGRQWTCGFEFDYANEESIYCRPLRVDEKGEERMPVPEAASDVRVAFLPPMSGLAATEDRLDSGSIDVRIGEGRTAEVLRNLCYQISSKEGPAWADLVDEIKRLFGVRLNEPVYIKERGQITMSYRDARQGAVELDLASSGRGLQQTLLLLAHLFTHPNSVLLLDEPDAHLEILRQRQIYHLMTDSAARQGCQIIAASHSEVILEEAADRDILVAFVGKPHRIDDRGTQVLKSLKAIGFDQYYQAEQTGWVLYLEGATDLAILRAFAKRLNHPATEVLELPFVHYAGNVPQKARDHFYGLREAKPDLAGVALFDSIDRDLKEGGPLVEMKWERREVENYLAFPETLLAYARDKTKEAGPLFESAGVAAMETAIQEVTEARRTLGQPDPFDVQTKASDEALTPIFRIFFQKLGIPNLMQKTDYHTLAPFVPDAKLSPEVAEKLDEIVRVARRATPVQ